MAEFCADCAKRYLGFSDRQIKAALFSDEPELCEGCGEVKPILVMPERSLWEDIKKFFKR